VLENEGIKKLTTLEAPKGVKSIFARAVMNVHAKISD
jgi:hypothetical protein